MPNTNAAAVAKNSKIAISHFSFLKPQAKKPQPKTSTHEERKSLSKFSHNSKMINC